MSQLCDEDEEQPKNLSRICGCKRCVSQPVINKSCRIIIGVVSDDG